MHKVLLVEDNAENRDALSRRLQRRGFEVVIATDGKQGVALAQSEAPDVILLDISLPEMDGFEFIEELCKEGANRSIPIVVITCKTIAVEDRRRLNGSVERILLKTDLSREDLLRQVRDLATTYARR